MWVAYITKSHNPQPIPDALEDYSACQIDTGLQDPYAVFLGTHEMKKIMQESQNVSLEEFKAKEEQIIRENLYGYPEDEIRAQMAELTVRLANKYTIFKNPYRFINDVHDAMWGPEEMRIRSALRASQRAA